MASIVITALRDGDGPSEGTLALAALAREISDRIGATVYATSCVDVGDELDDWVSTLGIAGVDRIACARSTEPIDDAGQVHAELIRRLAPRMVLVPNNPAGIAIAESIAAALDGRVEVDVAIEWRHDDCYAVGSRILGGEEVIIAAVEGSVGATPRGSDDIDVLFFDVEPKGDSALEASSPA